MLSPADQRYTSAPSSVVYPTAPIGGCAGCGDGIGAVVPGGLAAKAGQIVGVVGGAIMARRFVSKSIGATLVGAVVGYIIGSAVDSARASSTVQVQPVAKVNP
jgi:hypothetical protein